MGNILDCFKGKNDQYASFIDTNDNLLLSNIQERIEEYDDKVTKINSNVGTLKNNYLNLVKDFKYEHPTFSDLSSKYSTDFIVLLFWFLGSFVSLIVSSKKVSVS